MKDTPLLKLLDEIEGYRPIAGTDPFPYIVAKLQSLLPYERECIEGAYDAGIATTSGMQTSDFKCGTKYYSQTFKQ